MSTPKNDWPEITLPEGCSLRVVAWPSDEEVTITLTTKEGFFAQTVDSAESYRRYDQEEKETTVKELYAIAMVEGKLEEQSNELLYGNPHGPVHQPTPRGILHGADMVAAPDELENSYGAPLTPEERRQAELAPLPFKTFYVTTATNHPGGAGYWEVHARDREEARQVAFKHLGAKWAFDYERLEDIHEFDRERCHGTLT